MQGQALKLIAGYDFLGTATRHTKLDSYSQRMLQDVADVEVFFRLNRIAASWKRNLTSEKNEGHASCTANTPPHSSYMTPVPSAYFSCSRLPAFLPRGCNQTPQR